MLLRKKQSNKGRYATHKYWSKKPFDLIANLIQQYSCPNDVVLDPFCGSGVSLVESVRLNRRFIGIDLNPIAIRIAKSGLSQATPDELLKTVSHLKETIEPILRKYYLIQCPQCRRLDALCSHVIWLRNAIIEIWIECPTCGNLRSNGHDATFTNPFKLLSFQNKADFALLPNPRINIPPGLKLSDLFSARNFYTLTLLLNHIRRITNQSIRELLELAFSAALPQASRLIPVIRHRQGGLHRAQIGSWTNGFWRPDEHFEIYPWRCFETRIRRLKNALKETNTLISSVEELTPLSLLKKSKGHTLIHGDAAETLASFPNQCIDYAVCDPPHGDRIAYLEMSQLWNGWFNQTPDWEKEIVISDSPARNKTREDYQYRLTTTFFQISRVLRPEKAVTIIFNHPRTAVWRALLCAISAAGWVIETIDSFDYEVASIAQETRPKALTSDILLTCRRSSTDKPEKPCNAVPIELLILLLKNAANSKKVSTHDLLLALGTKMKNETIGFLVPSDFLTACDTIFDCKKNCWSLKKIINE